jgi:hypothetical protein
MSRHVAIQVLERQADFLANIEEAGEWGTTGAHAACSCCPSASHVISIETCCLRQVRSCALRAGTCSILCCLPCESVHAHSPWARTQPCTARIRLLLSPASSADTCRYAPCVGPAAFHPGLVRTEEVHAVQHKAAVRLERLQHQRAWNIINLEHQLAHKAATEVPPLAVSSTGCTSADTLQHLAATAGQDEQKRQSGAGDPQQQGEGSSGSGGTGSRRPGIMLEEMSQVKAGLRQRANRHK